MRRIITKTLTRDVWKDSQAQPVYHARTRPWINKEGVELDWSPRRKKVALLIDHRAFDFAITGLVTLNFLLIIYAADLDAKCYPEYYQNEDACPYYTKNNNSLEMLDTLFLVLYSLEALLHIYVFRFDYLKSRLHQLDAFVLFTGWGRMVATGLINLNFLRIIRVMRVTKAFRVAVGIRELYLLLNGFMSSMRAIFFGTVLLLLVLLCCAIAMVELVHPVNSTITYFGCSECTIAYHTVLYAVVTLFKQLIAGDSWIISFPVLDEAPWTGLIMITIVAIVMLGVTNLILTVIVERAAESREKDREDQARQKLRSQHESKEELRRICKQLDTDDSGKLTQDELLQAFHTSDEFRNIMMLLEVQEDDLGTFFKLLDQDGSGDLDYEEFCEELTQLQTHDQRLALAMTRLGVVEMHHSSNIIDAKLEKTIKLLSSHYSFLHSLDSKVNQLLATSNKTDASETNVDPKPIIPESMNFEGVSCGALSRKPEVSEAADDMLQITQEIKDASVLKSDVVHMLEHQIAALRSQAAAATSLTDCLLLNDDSQQLCESMSNMTLSKAALDKLSSLAANLRDHFQKMNVNLADGAKKLGHITSSLDARELSVYGLEHGALHLADKTRRSASPAWIKPSQRCFSDPASPEIWTI